MNRYLLLRDNKQSGPYSAEELIAKGIKAYDLVWIEGKSAAWRYPSELEELKTHAPAVEEQPFDRFYRRSETTPATRASEVPSRYEPLTTGQAPQAKAFHPSRKVYINFPGSGTSVPVVRKPVNQPVARTIEEAPRASEPTPLADEPVTVVTPPTYSQPVAPVQRPRQNMLRYGSIAACALMLVFVSMLVVSYRNQRRSIEEMNNLMARLRQQQNEQVLAARAALASRTIPVSAIQQADVATANDYNTRQPVAAPVNDRPVAAPHSEKPVINTAPATVIPVSSTAPASTAASTPRPDPVAPKAMPAENLFKLVSVKPNKYRVGMLGGISNLQFVLTNSSRRELEQVAVEVKYLSPEKKIVKTQTVYFHKVAPGDQPVLDVPKSNRGVSIDYTIADIKS